MKNAKSLTLVELTVVVVLVAGLMLAINGGGLFFISQIYANIERQQMHTEIDYALEDMKLRCISAVNLQTVIYPGTSSNELVFRGESDVYTITPDSETDNTWYRYFVSNGNLILRTCTASSCASGTDEVLVESKFSPTLTFAHVTGDEPNFLRVTITATNTHVPVGCDPTVSKTDGIRFWFINPVQ